MVSVIGLLVSLAIPAFAKARQTSILQRCINNQRAVYQAVQRYEMDNNASLFSIRSDGVAIRNTLIAGQYISTQNNFDCPASQTKDFDDYTLTYIGRDFSTVHCNILPAEHVLP